MNDFNCSTVEHYCSTVVCWVDTRCCYTMRYPRVQQYPGVPHGASHTDPELATLSLEPYSVCIGLLKHQSYLGRSRGGAREVEDGGRGDGETGGRKHGQVCHQESHHGLEAQGGVAAQERGAHDLVVDPGVEAAVIHKAQVKVHPKITASDLKQ